MPDVDFSKPVLIYLANGVQGAAVTRAALHHGLQVRALVRRPAHASALKERGVQLVQADLFDPGSLVAASQGASSAIIQLPTGTRDEMCAQAVHAFNAAKIAGLSSIILKLASASRAEPCEEPSFVANAMVEDIARRSGLLSAIVRPTMYLDNLLKPQVCADLIKRGVFAVPIAPHQRIAWTSAEDCAEATIRLLTTSDASGGDYRIAGPEGLTGAALADRITVGLGRHVVFRSYPLDEFERDLDEVMGAGTGRRIASKFRYFATHPDDADAILAAPHSRTAELEDFVPTLVETWIRARRRAFLGDDAPSETR
jgi:uncharacterized protein YbjT (DUF2867 family)